VLVGCADSYVDSGFFHGSDSPLRLLSEDETEVGGTGFQRHGQKVGDAAVTTAGQCSSSAVIKRVGNRVLGGTTLHDERRSKRVCLHP